MGPMSVSGTLRALGVAATLSPLLTACGSSGIAAGSDWSSSSVPSVPALGNVLATSISKPRVIQVQVGVNGNPSEVQRVVIDSRAGYQTISLSGHLVGIVKHGHEYLRSTVASIGSCWAATSRKARVSTNIVFPSDLSEHYTAKGSDRTILYTLHGGEQITVNARTHLIRSNFTPALPSGGVPAYHDAYSYPGSIVELPVPAPLCH
jgi:hypothetical protein